MKKIYTVLVTLFILLSSIGQAQSDLIITGVVDGDLTGGKPKIIEFYVVNDIPDLSLYGFGSANNGGGTDGVEFIFPADAYTAGDFIYLTTASDGDDLAFEDFFGFAPTYQSGAAAINGDDAVELFLEEELVDLYGDQNTIGDDTPWDYTDSWAYRQNGTGPSTTFDAGQWIVPGAGTLDGETSNETAANPFPIGTYDPQGGGSAGEVTIQEIQETTDPGGDSPLVNQEVTTDGIVTAAYEDGFWIQDGTGPWSGIFVADADGGVAQGDAVTVTGTVQENFGLTRISSVSEVVINSSDNTLPAPQDLSTGTAGIEEYESVLIQLEGVTCTDANLGFGEWQINDGSGDYVVDDLLYDAQPDFLTGYDITGIGYYSFNAFKVLPRDEADVVINENASSLGVGFEAAAISVDETAGTLSIEVNIVNPVIVETIVEVVVTGGTAENGVHFTFTDPTTLIFTAGDDSPESFEVEIIDDMEENADREVVFALQNLNNNGVLYTDELTLTIEDDDTGLMITDIATAAEEDADGVAVNDGEEFTVAGLVYGVNMNGSGTSFTLIDQTGGVGVYSNDVIDGYTVTEGDSIVLTGIVNQFNGLTQMNPSSIDLISQGNDIAAPMVVTDINAETESQLVQLECVWLVDPGQWSNSGPGFNVTVTNGSNEFQVRIDNDVDLYNATAPLDTFDVTGIGGQFDTSFPFTEGYQLLPRRATDLNSDDCNTVQGPSNDDCADAADLSALTGGSLDDPQTSGTFSNVGATTSGDDPNPNDETANCWFGTPLVSNTIWFTFEGDGNEYFIETVDCGVADYIDDGDTQMAIFIGNCGNLTQVACNEDGPQATSEEFPAGITLLTEEGETYLVMVDGYEGADGEFCMQMTLTSALSTAEAEAFELNAYPNPTRGWVSVESPVSLENLTLFNVIGQRVKAWNDIAAERFEFDTNDLESGVYLLQATSGDRVTTLRLVVE